MLENLKILLHQGKQFIPDVTQARVPGIFRGKPVIHPGEVNEKELVDLCPTDAISAGPLSIDLGRCVFCGECAFASSGKIEFTNEFKMSTNERDGLFIREGDQSGIILNPHLVREEISDFFSGSLKLRQVSAAGDNSCELELNACGNVNFDMGRFGIEFVASPRHADGIVITGPISQNMAEPLQICYDAIPTPKLIILAGTDAISGGIFLEQNAENKNPALDRTFLNRYHIDLYVPGNPVHPLTFINGVLDLVRKRKTGR